MAITSFRNTPRAVSEDTEVRAREAADQGQHRCIQRRHRAPVSICVAGHVRDARLFAFGKPLGRGRRSGGLL